MQKTAKNEERPTILMANAEFLPHVCELVNEGEMVTIRAKGNSMRPFLESNRDDIRLKKFESLRTGDVVLAEIAPGHYVLHRIDHITKPNGMLCKKACSDPLAHVTLRGDGNIRGTEQCRLRNVRAIACQFVRKGKTWDVDSWRWRTYSVIWRKLLFFRRILLAVYRLLWLHEWPQRMVRRKPSII